VNRSDRVNLVAKADDFSRVTINWYVIPNGNKQVGGWLPVYDLDGKQRGNTYWNKGYDLETALADAQAMGEQEAARYVGDWNVVVGQKPGTPGAPKASKAKRSSKGKSPPARPSPWGAVGTSSDVLPWRTSYANWTVRVGEAAARHGSSIAFGSETYDAWKAGVSPDSYAKARARR
jgi:hypothetical protein